MGKHRSRRNVRRHKVFSRKWLNNDLPQTRDCLLQVLPRSSVQPPLFTFWTALLLTLWFNCILNPFKTFGIPFSALRNSPDTKIDDLHFPRKLWGVVDIVTSYIIKNHLLISNIVRNK